MPKYKYVDGVKYRVVPQSVLGYALVREGSDNSLPIGGTEGQVLAKASNADYDVEWATVESGGTDKVHVCVPVYDEDAESYTFTETWNEIKAYIDSGYIVAVRHSYANQTMMEYGSNIKYDADTGIYSFTAIRYDGLHVNTTTYTTNSADGHPTLLD